MYVRVVYIKFQPIGPVSLLVDKSELNTEKLLRIGCLNFKGPVNSFKVIM